MTSPIDLMEITRRATEADAMEADATEADGSQSKDDFKDKKTKDGSEDTVIKVQDNCEV